MHWHGPSCLSGPVSQKRRCWAPASPGDRLTEDRAREPGVRTELVERVRREIAAGTYDTPEKWALALDRLLDRLEEHDG
ncbi:MAG TPA: flagellar biosynthesis anti-sigma factor FlgM [Gemmataceae bacterium]|nr:flagellar biosynthesis anti-sigma factor FlgM [Gemmataceae bacterium]